MHSRARNDSDINYSSYTEHYKARICTGHGRARNDSDFSLASYTEHCKARICAVHGRARLEVIGQKPLKL